MHLRRASFALLVLFALLAGACAPVTATQPPGVAADIDGVTIPVSAVDAQFDALLESPQFAADVEAQEGFADQVQAVLLTVLITEELYRTGGRQLQISVDDGDVDEAIAAQTGGVTDPEELQEMFAMQGVSLEFVRLQARIQLLQEQISEALAGDEVLTDEEIEAMYSLMFGTEPEARHILLDNQEDAEEVLERLDAGEDFGDLAVEVSTDPSAETNRGELGPVTEGRFDEDFTAAVLAAEDGGIVGPVETQFGYHVIERLAPPALEEVEDEVRTAARSDSLGAALEAWTREQVAAADITVNPRFGTWDDVSGSVQASSALDRPSPLGR